MWLSQRFTFLISVLFLKISIICMLFGKINYDIDPDENRDVKQLIESRGFKAESHYVTTDDGYILTLHRIVNPRLNSAPKRPILLHHCFLCSSMDFIINVPGIGNEKSKTVFRNKTVGDNLAFTLSLFGYDVWLGNSRGNAYSINHTKLDPSKDKNFWHFSYNEMIDFDLPASIHYILNETRHSTMSYIGFSQGTLIMFGLLASKPQYSKIIRPFIALAPTTRFNHLRSPIKYILNSLLVNYLYYVGGAFLLPKGLLNNFAIHVCKYALIREICPFAISLFAGFNYPQLNKTRIPTYVSHTPAGASSWNLAHLTQIILSGKFQKFDYGQRVNMKVYGSKNPPVFNLKSIDSKEIAILYSKNDWLSAPEDVDTLKNELKGKIILDYEVPHPDWNHLDFIWGHEASKFVYKTVLEVLERFQ